MFMIQNKLSIFISDVSHSMPFGVLIIELVLKLDNN